MEYDYAWMDVDGFFNADLNSMPAAPTNPNLKPTTDVYPFPFLYHLDLAGNSGWGWSWNQFYSMWPALIFAVIWFICRTIGRKYIFNQVAKLSGVKGVKKQRKFGYSLWLAIFYAGSTVWGYYTFRDKPYMSFPQDQEMGMMMNADYPQPADSKHRFYYTYELGFFLAELFAIFVEDRRSDFLEYVIHHLSTIFLIVMSYSCFWHRHGAYILLLHDASDIFLCVAKVFHYANYDPGVYFGFTMFTGLFAWLRLYCFPINIHVIALGTHVNMPFFNWYWIQWCALFILQILHIYWFALVVRMIFRLIAGTKGDVRSDDDDEEDDEVQSPKLKVDNSKGKKKTKKQ